MRLRDLSPAALLAVLAIAWLALREEEQPAQLPAPAAPPKPPAPAGVMSTKQAFVARLQPIALQVERSDARIRAALGITQAAHESGWGASELSSPSSKLEVRNNAGVLRVGPANNLFGITAELGTYWRSQNKPFVLMTTHEWVTPAAVLKTDVVVQPLNPKTGLVKVRRKRPFRAYATIEESYLDWARLMQTEAYVKVGALEALRRGDLKGAAAAFKRIGYATDPDYATRIVDVGGLVARLV